MDEYLSCAEYTGGQWFHTFEKGGQYYFAYNNSEGKTYLRSQGYASEAARDNGVESVKKNAPNKERWTTGEEGGVHFFALKAGNHQEIARSCDFKSKSEMETAFGWIHSDRSIFGSGAKFVDGKWWTAYMFAAKVEKKTEKIEVKHAEVKERKVIKGDPIKAEVRKGETRVVKGEKLELRQAEVRKGQVRKGEARKAEARKVVVNRFVDKVDDYLPCKEYKGHTVTDKINNIAFFKHENGQLYFVAYDKNGDVRLRSEGFPTAKQRDIELAGVVKYMDSKDMYEREQKGEYFMDILKDKSGREVGRSCLQKKVVKAAPVAPVVAAAAVAAVVAPKPKPTPKPEPKPKPAPKPVDKDDDYLPCNAYKGHKINDKVNRVAFFKHKNGQFYFAVYDKTGDVRIRSEGFRTTQKRDSELSGVLKNLNDKKMYNQIKKGDYFINVLKDKSGREVGRSCLNKKKKPVVPVVAPVVAAAAAAVAAAPKPKPKPKPQPKKAVAAAPVKEVVKETKKKGFNWLWLLALIPLLFLLWRGCGGCAKPAAVVVPPVEVKKTPPPVVEETVAPPEEEKIIEETPVVEEPIEEVVPAIGVEAGFERVNEHK